MKKKLSLILLLVFIFLIVFSCVDCRSPKEAMGYIMYTEDKTSEMSLLTDAPLPQHRVDNFLDTLKILFEDVDLNFYMFYVYYENVSKNLIVSLGNDEGISVAINKNFSDAITDTKDKNYYTMVAELNGSIRDTDLESHKDIRAQVYFREKKESGYEIACMIMIDENVSQNYEYLADITVGNMRTAEAVGSLTALPDILK